MGCGESAETKAKVEKLGKEVDEKKTQIAKLEAELHAAHSAAPDTHETQAQLAKLQSDLTAVKAELAAALQAKSALEQEQESTRKTLEELRQAQEASKGLVDSLARDKDAESSEIARLSAEVATLQQQLADSEALKTELPGLQQAVNEATERNSALTLQLQAEQTALAERQEAIDTLNRDMEARATAILDLATQVEALKKEGEEAAQQKAALEAELNGVRAERDGLTGRVAQLVSEVDVLRAQQGSQGPDAAVKTKSKHRDCINLSRKAKLGVAAKYYCNKRMPDEEDICGPLRGTNCLRCQKLDIEARDLPKGFLVNTEGRIARKAENSDYWYCGAAVLQGGGGDKDGYCGPVEGPNCRACQDLQHLVQGRYRSLLEDD